MIKFVYVILSALAIIVFGALASAAALELLGGKDLISNNEKLPISFYIPSAVVLFVVCFLWGLLALKRVYFFGCISVLFAECLAVSIKYMLFDDLMLHQTWLLDLFCSLVIAVCAVFAGSLMRVKLTNPTD